jgi:hypothetical protein
MNELYRERTSERRGLQNADDRQFLPIFEGEAEKQNLPRQILPIGNYSPFSSRDQAGIATDSFGGIGK